MFNGYPSNSFKMIEKQFLDVGAMSLLPLDLQIPQIERRSSKLRLAGFLFRNLFLQ
jgi:hypothetical protein